MKIFLPLLAVVSLISCSGDEDPGPNYSGITLTSEIIEHPNGGFEYQVFCVEEGSLQRVNTKTDALKPYSIGVMTYSNSEGKATGVAIASLTADLQFVSINDFPFEEVEAFPDSLERFSLAIDAVENGHIGIISKTRQLKVKIKLATFGVPGKAPESQLVFQGEYL